MLRIFNAKCANLLNTNVHLFQISNFYLIHSDLGPSTIPDIVFGARWFVSFIDNCTRVTLIFSLKHKSDVSTVLPNFYSMVKN